MNLLLRYFGGMCLMIGVFVMVLDLVRLFVRVPLVQQPNVGTATLMVTVGLIAIRQAKT